MVRQACRVILTTLCLFLLAAAAIEVRAQNSEISSETAKSKSQGKSQTIKAGKHASAESIPPSKHTRPEENLQAPAQNHSQVGESDKGRQKAQPGDKAGINKPKRDYSVSRDQSSSTAGGTDVETAAVPAKSKSAKVITGDAANGQIAEASHLQASRQEIENDLLVQLIDLEDAVRVANGDGDVATTGACAAEFDTLCAGTAAPGEGRFAECLTQNLRQQESGNFGGSLVSDQCKEELASFKQDRATNINKDISLAKACSRDAKKYCKKPKYLGDGKTLACLRNHYSKLAGRCQSEVFRSQRDGAEDFRADAQLHHYCSKEADNLCSDVEPGQGRIQACLREKQGRLTWQCKVEVFRHEVENSADMRLNVVLLRTCMGEQQAFCNFPEAGDARIFECLEDMRYQPDFGIGCRTHVELVLQRRSTDFRLNPQLAEACKSDIEDTCGLELQRSDDVASEDGKVLNCLQDHRLNLVDAECKRQVHRNMKRRSEDIRLNYPLASVCGDDRKRLCPNEKPGSARVIGCLQRHRSELQFECRASLFDQEQQMAEDIDFQYPLRAACMAEIQVLCSADHVTSGHARVVRCLQTHLDSAAVGQKCRQEVQAQTARAATDYRLNYRLREACRHDVSVLCPDACKNATAQACGGRALQCLSIRSEEILERSCLEEVLYFQRMEVSDFRNDVLLAEACRPDVDKFCKNVEPGEGRTLACLRVNRAALQPPCRKEELRLSIMAAADIRLRPKLQKLCGAEIAVFCHDIKPGRGRVMQCLQENLGQPEFGDKCTEQVTIRQEAMQADFRENVPLAQACSDEIDATCAAEKKQAHGQSKVLKCLLRNLGEEEALGGSCGKEVSRAARMALWGYTAGAALTESCDTDVQLHCQAQRHRLGVYSVGYVGKCLAGHLAAGKGLASVECRSLVLAAAPPDSRALINAESAQHLLREKLEAAQKGFLAKAASSPVLTEAKLVDPEAKGASMITLTGWLAAAAVAAMLMVVILGITIGLRRLFGKRTQPYTVITPRDGDA